MKWVVEASEVQGSVCTHSTPGCITARSLRPPQVPPLLPASSAWPELTIICVISSAFLEQWKELACALLHMAWLTMHRLWTRQSFKAGSWGKSWLQEVCTPAPRTAPE